MAELILPDALFYPELRIDFDQIRAVYVHDRDTANSYVSVDIGGIQPKRIFYGLKSDCQRIFDELCNAINQDVDYVCPRRIR